MDAPAGAVPAPPELPEVDPVPELHRLPVIDQHPDPKAGARRCPRHPARIDPHPPPGAVAPPCPSGRSASPRCRSGTRPAPMGRAPIRRRLAPSIATIRNRARGPMTGPDTGHPAGGRAAGADADRPPPGADREAPRRDRQAMDGPLAAPRGTADDGRVLAMMGTAPMPQRAHLAAPRHGRRLHQHRPRPGARGPRQRPCHAPEPARRGAQGAGPGGDPGARRGDMGLHPERPEAGRFRWAPPRTWRRSGLPARRT